MKLPSITSGGLQIPVDSNVMIKDLTILITQKSITLISGTLGTEIKPEMKFKLLSLSGGIHILFINFHLYGRHKYLKKEGYVWKYNW